MDTPVGFVDPIYVVLVTIIMVFLALMVFLFVMRSILIELRGITRELQIIKHSQALRPIVHTGNIHTSTTEHDIPALYSRSPRTGTLSKVPSQQLYSDATNEPTSTVQPLYTLVTPSTMPRSKP